jgi:hypothetical protein
LKGFYVYIHLQRDTPQEGLCTEETPREETREVRKDSKSREREHKRAQESKTKNKLGIAVHPNNTYS